MKVKIGKPKKKRNKYHNDSLSISCASSASSASSSSFGSDNSDDNFHNNSEVDSDNSLSEDEQNYDTSAVSEYYWLIDTLHMDDDDKEMYVTG